MTRSPLKFFFLSGVILALVGYSFGFLYRDVFLREKLNRQNHQELMLARFYHFTGQPEKAIQEYKTVIVSEASLDVKTQAYSELKNLLNEQYRGGLAVSYFAYIIWSVSPKLYLLSTIFILTWLILCVFTLLYRRPTLVILPIRDFSGKNIGDTVPQMANDRLRELTQKLEHLANSSLTISDTLDVPITGIISDENALDVSSIIETALLFSGGPTNLPLPQFFDTLRLWLEQPKYIVRGTLRLSGNAFLLQLILIDQSKRQLEKSWSIQIEQYPDVDILSQVVDTLIYSLMFHFNDKISAKQWESYKALNDGLEKLFDYSEKGNNILYLTQARAALEKALELDPGYDLAAYNLGLLLLRLGEYELAKDRFREISSSSTQSQLREFSLYGYGVSLFQISQDWSYKRAIEIFKNLIQISIEDDLKTITRGTLAITYARLADRDKSQTKFFIDLALKEVQAIRASRHTTNQFFAIALTAEGYSHLALGNIEQSISCFIQASEKEPDGVSCLIGLAEAYTRNNQNSNAIQVFRKVELLSPSSFYSSYRLGNLYRDIGDVENAIQSYKRASQFGLAHLALGKIYFSEQEYKSALDEFRLATIQNKRLGEAWASIALTICEMDIDDQNLFKEAEASAHRSLQLEKNQLRIWYRRAILSRVLYLAGKLDKALFEAKKAAELAPDQPQVYYYLALVEKSLGYKEKAREHIQKILQLDDGEWNLKAEILQDQI